MFMNELLTRKNVLLIFIIALIALQMYLSKRKSKWPGLILPIASLAYALMFSNLLVVVTILFTTLYFVLRRPDSRIKPNIRMMLLHMFCFLILYAVSVRFFDDWYLFEWMSRNLYAYLWIIVLICDCIDKCYAASLMTAGNVIGIVFGQLHGDWVRNYNIAKITSDMSAEQVARLHYHHGVFMWLACILIILVGGYVARYFYRRVKTHRIGV